MHCLWVHPKRQWPRGLCARQWLNGNLPGRAAGNAGMRSVAFQGIPPTWNVPISIIVSTSNVVDLGLAAVPLLHNQRHRHCFHLSQHRTAIAQHNRERYILPDDGILLGLKPTCPDCCSLDGRHSTPTLATVSALLVRNANSLGTTIDIILRLRQRLPPPRGCNTIGTSTCVPHQASPNEALRLLFLL